MENALTTSDILNKPTDWQTYYLQCEKVKSDLVIYSKDLRFLQQLLNRYFDEMVKNGNLDEMRESLMRFQDLCYDCDRLKKRVKDQQSRLLDTIKGASSSDPDSILKEQSSIENRKSTLLKEFKMVKKEMYALADHVIQANKENENLTYLS
ncbi:MAG: hypothetical protein GY931_16665 [Maribacter sp.]|nr:hypothetical protein [Maribacter sp.]